MSSENRAWEERGEGSKGKSKKKVVGSGVFFAKMSFSQLAALNAEMVLRGLTFARSTAL